MAKIHQIEKNTSNSSLDLLWDQAFEQLDAWVERTEFREEVLLQSVLQFAENVKRNHKNSKELSEQFSKELHHWEKISREELLNATTVLQYFFPVKSYEEINKQLDDVQNNTVKLTSGANLLNGEHVDNFVSVLKDHVEFRQNNRYLYVENMKQTASIIQNKQRDFLKIMNNQMKNVFFPFHTYMEGLNESIKSNQNTGVLQKMVDQKTFDPYDMFKKFSDQWEKQANDFIKGSSNDPEFVSYSRLTSDTQARYLEFFKKNQEFFANQWNVPTKADLSNVAKLAIQTEEKLDSLEEQLWKLQDSVDSSNKEMESITEVSRDIIKLVKQLKKSKRYPKKS